jgi:tetratricopeptide (TPR) repeat protein
MLSMQGRYEEALAKFDKALELFNHEPIYKNSVGLLYGLMGRKKEALQIAKKMEELYRRGLLPPVEVAVTYVGLDDRDAVFAWLEKAFEERDHTLAGTIYSSELTRNGISADPRYVALLRKMNFPVQHPPHFTEGSPTAANHKAN